MQCIHKNYREKVREAEGDREIPTLADWQPIIITCRRSQGTFTFLMVCMALPNLNSLPRNGVVNVVLHPTKPKTGTGDVISSYLQAA